MPMTSRSLPGAAVRRTGDTMLGDLTLENGVAIRGARSNGSVRDMLEMTTGDRIVVGQTTNELRLEHSGTLTEFQTIANTLRSNRNHLVESKAADESLTTDTTLQNDDELVLAVLASRTYLVRLSVAVTTTTAGDFKHAFALPSGATIQMVGDQHFSGSESANEAGWDGSSKAVASTNGALIALNLVGLLTVDTTAGNLQYQWAQNGSSGTTTVEAGSSLEIVEML